MNDHCEEPKENQRLADMLLALDSQMPDSWAEGREIAREALRRDRRWARILSRMTAGFLLLTVLGVGFSIWFYYLKFAPAMGRYKQAISALEQHFTKQGPQLSQPDLLDITARTTVGQGWALFQIQAITLWGTVLVFVVMLAAAVCTVLLILVTRRATLRQIQASLLVLSEQLDSLERSLRGGQATGGSPAPKEPNM